MWNGAFSPFRKSSDDEFKTPDGQPAIDPDKVDYQDGQLTITFPNGVDYTWDVDESDYEDFVNSGYAWSWVNDNLAINHIGDWGWPWGRSHDDIGMFYDKQGRQIFYTRKPV